MIISFATLPKCSTLKSFFHKFRCFLSTGDRTHDHPHGWDAPITQGDGPRTQRVCSQAAILEMKGDIISRFIQTKKNLDALQSPYSCQCCHKTILLAHTTLPRKVDSLIQWTLCLLFWSFSLIPRPSHTFSDLHITDSMETLIKALADSKVKSAYHSAPVYHGTRIR